MMDDAINILLVEDTPDLATMILETLMLFGGISAHWAKSGEEALEYLDNNHPDAILLDIGLPGMSGWELLENIKARTGGYTVPIIVTTAYGDKFNRIVGKLQYVARYLTKPYTTRELMDALDESLELYKLGA